jgi:hypothetical protein
MLRSFTIRTGRRQQGRSGWTLVELVVAVAVGLIVLAAFVAITLSINASVVAVGNYNDLDKASRMTLDQLSRDVRNASSVSTASTMTILTLTNTFSGTNLITYRWTANSNVTRTVTSIVGVAAIAGTPEVVLPNCDFLSFHYYIRIPTNNLQFVSITNTVSTNLVKLISVSWRCSRSILGSKLNTESVQTANIAVRN